MAIDWSRGHRWGRLWLDEVPDARYEADGAEEVECRCLGKPVLVPRQLGLEASIGLGGMIAKGLLALRFVPATRPGDSRLLIPYVSEWRTGPGLPRDLARGVREAFLEHAPEGRQADVGVTGASVDAVGSSVAFFFVLTVALIRLDTLDRPLAADDAADAVVDAWAVARERRWQR